MGLSLLLTVSRQHKSAQWSPEMKSQSVNSPKKNPPQLTWGKGGNLHSDMYQYLQKGHGEIMIVLLYTILLATSLVDSVTGLYCRFRKFISFNCIRKFNEQYLPLSSHFISNNSLQVLWTWHLCLDQSTALLWHRHFGQCVSNASYRSTTAKWDRQQLHKTSLLTWCSDFDLTFRTWYLFTSHMLYADLLYNFS